jgi:hypothetical protein
MRISQPSGVTVKTIGKGKMVYIPRIVPEVAVPAGSDTFPATDWVLPRNHEEIYRAVVDNLPEGISITTEDPLTTVTELLNREKTNETIVHFVNFDQRHKLAPFPVLLKKQIKQKVASVNFFSPEFDEPKQLKFTDEAGRVSFTVPAMKLYSMIVVSHK